MFIVLTLHIETAQVSGPAKPRGINVNAVPSKGTFKSSISLSEGAPATVQSTYGQVHGASMPQLMQAVRTVAQQQAEVHLHNLHDLNRTVLALHSIGTGDISMQR